MAVVTVKSSLITARDSGGKSTLSTGPRRLYDQADTVEVTNGDSIGSKFILGSVPSSASMRELVILCDAITDGITPAAADVGLYRTTQDGGAVVDADLFGSAVSLAAAITTGTNILHESGVLDIANLAKPLWQVLGLSRDPQVMYDVVATLTAAATATGTLTARITYAQGN